MKFCRISNHGNLFVRDGDGEEVVILKEEFAEFFAEIDEVRDELFPPGPIEIPDPVRHDDAYGRVNENASQPFDRAELKGAMGQLAVAIGNILHLDRQAS